MKVGGGFKDPSIQMKSKTVAQNVNYVTRAVPASVDTGTKMTN